MKNIKKTVVFCCDEKFVQHLIVAITSLICNAKVVESLRIFVISSGLSGEAQKRIGQCASGKGGALEFKFLNDHALLKNARVSGHISIASYYRLLIPSVLPKDIDRVLYADCDVVFETDVTPLFAEDLRGYALGAVENPGFNRWRELNMTEGCGYFNAGVLLIDLNEWRLRRISEKATKIILELHDRLLFWDQDALNSVINGEWRELESRWNQQFKHWEMRRPRSVSRHEWCRLLRQPYIIHYSAKSKPWEYCNDHPLRARYFYYCDKTCFQGFRPKPGGARDYFRRALKLAIRPSIRRILN